MQTGAKKEASSSNLERNKMLETKSWSRNLLRESRWSHVVIQAVGTAFCRVRDSNARRRKQNKRRDCIAYMRYMRQETSHELLWSNPRKECINIIKASRTIYQKASPKKYSYTFQKSRCVPMAFLFQILSSMILYDSIWSSRNPNV